MDRGYAASDNAVVRRTAWRQVAMPPKAGADHTPQPGSGSRDRKGLILAVAALVAAAVVLGAEFTKPTLYTAPRLEATFETVVTLLALLTAVLLAVRFIESRSVRDLSLFAGALSLGLTYVCVSVLPMAVGSVSKAWLTDFTVCCGVVTAALLVGVARPAAGNTVEGLKRPLVVASTCVGLGVAIEAFGAVLLANPRSPLSQRSGDDVQLIIHHPVLALLTILGAALFLEPAISLLRRRRAPAEYVLLPAALVLLATAQLGRLALPVMAPRDVILSDGLRLVAVVLLLTIAVTEAVAAYAATATTAASEERRRLARDLHDGLAQDLAFIAAHEARIAEALGQEHPVVRAAKRALTLSRGTISELSDAPGASVDQALEAVAGELSQRFGVDIVVDVRLTREPTAQVRQHLSRIVREAITNAARHGGARNVLVTLAGDHDTLTLRVRDDGCGISHSPGTNVNGGFGLISISERADALGGSLRIRPMTDRGTLLEVSVP